MKRAQSIARLAVLLIVAGLIAAVMIRLARPKAPDAAPQTQESTPSADALSGRRLDYPKNAILGENLENAVFWTRDGQRISLQDKQGDYLVMVYWASWCRYCQAEMEQLPDVERLLQARGDAKLLLVNALDGDRETAEQAEAYLKERDIRAEVVYDRENQVYQTLGIAKLPTMLILSPDSRLLAAFPGKSDGVSSVEAMLDYAASGYAAATLDFITGQMMEDGGVYTGMESEKAHPSGRDVLSESQGLLMEYAVEAQDQALFDQAYGYAKAHLAQDGLFRWYGSADANAPANAFLDDLRIYGALVRAQARWGGYEAEIASLEAALSQYNVTSEGPVDFYDFERRRRSDEFSLCYGDLETLRILEERTGNTGLYEKTRQRIDEGYISDEFPLYYASWSYREKAYSKKDLHTAEALYTLYHLAKEDLLKDASEQWLLEQLRGDGLMAGYCVDGSVTEGCGYESTGVYALAALIGMECGNDEICALAIGRMNQLRIFDSASLYDGAFGEKDGSGIYSFDQCMALKVYGRMDRALRISAEE